MGSLVYVGQHENKKGIRWLSINSIIIQYEYLNIETQKKKPQMGWRDKIVITRTLFVAKFHLSPLYSPLKLKDI